MDTGELISLYRKQSKMTVDELAQKSGVPKGTLNKIIGGVTKAPTLPNMKAIARALGKTLDDFDDSVPEDKKATGISSDGKYSSLIEKLDRLTPEQVCRVEGFVDCMLMEAAETTAEQTNAKLA